MKKGGGILILISLIFVLGTLSFSFALSQYNLTYDGNGNLITGDGKYREYNEFNQLISIRDGTNASGKLLETYIYDPSGDRILAKYEGYTSNGSTQSTAVVYVNDNFEREYTRLSGSPYVNDLIYVRDGNGIIGEIANNLTYMSSNYTQIRKLYYLDDHLGSTSVITNDSGTVLEETFYEPFGEIISGGTGSRYSFQGREYSNATQDYDFRFRKYNPDLMFFTKPDAMISNIYDPQGLNRYAFEKDNPYKYLDPTGKICIADDIAYIVIGISILALKGYIEGVVRGLAENKNAGEIYESSVDEAGKSVGVLSTDEGIVLFSGGGILGGGGVTNKLTPNEVGKIGEKWLSKEFGGESQVTFKTTLGDRRFDQVSAGIAMESKVGYQSLTSSNKLQIDKTAELLSTGQINRAENYFFTSPITGKGGASTNLLSYSESKGITNIQKTTSTLGNIFNKIKSIFNSIF